MRSHGAARHARRLFFLEHPMSPHGLKLSHAYLLLACLAAAPAFAQASAAVVAGNLSGHAQAGPAPPDDRIARGPRTDDTRDCDTRSVTTRSADGSSSAPASVDSSAVASGGYFGCNPDQQGRTR